MSVRTSRGLAFAGRSPRPSDGPSMRRNGLPDRHDIDRCIHVPVVARVATRTRPVTDRQRHRFLNVAARRTGLARRIPAVDALDALAVPLGLFFQHAGGLPDARIAQRAGEAVVLQHPAQVEVFDVDHVETLHHRRTELVHRIGAAIADLLVQPGDVLLDVRPALAALLTAGKPLLIEREPTLPLCAVLRVGDFLAGRERGESIDAEIDANRFTGFRQVGWRGIDDERHEVAPARLADQANRGRRRNRAARPLHLDRADLGELQGFRLRLERESAFGVVRRLRAILALERRIAGALVEEIRVRNLQVAQRLLQADAGDFIEPHRFRLPLEHSQALVRFRVADALAGPVAVTAQSQPPVPDEPNAAKRAGKVLRLLGRRVTAECPSGFHASHYKLIKCETQMQRPLRGRPSTSQA